MASTTRLPPDKWSVSAGARSSTRATEPGDVRRPPRQCSALERSRTRPGRLAWKCELVCTSVSASREVAISAASRCTSPRGYLRRRAPGEVLVSRTVRDLVAGSRLEFTGGGAQKLKGIPGKWRLFSVNQPEHVDGTMNRW